MKLKFTIGIMFLLTVPLLTGCIEEIERTATEYGVRIDKNIISVNGSDYNVVWIKNTNTCLVIVRQVQLPEKTTMWIQIFSLHETKYIKYDEPVGWYIYTIDYKEMGYIDFEVW